MSKRVLLLAEAMPHFGAKGLSVGSQDAPNDVHWLSELAVRKRGPAAPAHDMRSYDL